MSADRYSESDPPRVIDFSSLYDRHPDYVARRQDGSLEQAQIDIEVQLFKLPNLLRLLSPLQKIRCVLEIGCATGELVAAVPVEVGGRRVGMDISAANVAAAKARFPEVDFYCGDLSGFSDAGFDVVIISDVLEHVPDDLELLRLAAQLGDVILVNLPLEDNWLNRNRRYGPSDVSGHLRKYSLAQGLTLFESAGLKLMKYSQVWLHETSTDKARRDLRRVHLGHEFSGGWPTRVVKKVVVAAVDMVPPLGRKLFSSNLFAAVCRK